MKKQILVVHGGDTFPSSEKFLEYLGSANVDLDRFRNKKDDWKSKLQSKLGDEYDVLLPAMPNKQNAQYHEWKVWLERIIPLLNNEIIFVGHSLGATFLVKYLSENIISKKVKGLFLVAGHYDFVGGELCSFVAPDQVSLPTDRVFVYHSKDDFVVPFESFEKIKSVLTNFNASEFVDRNHFLDEDFPEIVRDIVGLWV